MKFELTKVLQYLNIIQYYELSLWQHSRNIKLSKLTATASKYVVVLQLHKYLNCNKKLSLI